MIIAPLGAVDTRLVEEGRLRKLASADELEVERRAVPGTPTGRDPAILLDLLLTALEP